MNAIENRTADRISFSVPEFSERLGISEAEGWRMIRRGDLRSFQIGRRRLVAREELEQFVRSRSGARG